VVSLPEQGSAEVVFRFEGDKIDAVLSLRVRAGQVELVHREKPEQVIPLGQPSATEWQVQAELRHGVLRCKAWPVGKQAPANWHATRYAGWTGHDLARLVVQVEQGEPVALRRLEIAGAKPDAPRLTAEQLKQLAPAQVALKESAALHKKGQRDQAARRWQEALAAHEKVLGSDHPLVLDLLADGAVSWTFAAQYGLARQVARQAVERCVRVYGEEHPHTASAYNNRGLIAFYRGEYDDAQKDWERALDLRRTLRGTDHPETATTLDNLATMHSTRGRWAQARRYHEQALAAYRKGLGPTHMETLVCAVNLAGTLYELDMLQQARPLVEETLALAVKHLPKGSSVPVAAQSLLGLIHLKNGDREKARDLLEQALPKARQVFGPAHPSTLQVAGNLAAILTQVGDFASARPLLEATLAAKRRILPAGHIDIAASVANLAHLLAKLGHLEKARDSYLEALRTLRRVEGAQSPRTLHLLMGYADVVQRLGDLPAARKIYESLLSAVEKGTDRMAEADVLEGLSLVLYRQQEEPGRARRYQERRRELLVKQLGPRHPATIAALQNEAAGLLHLGLFAEAEQDLTALLPLVRQAFGDADYLTALTLLNLGQARVKQRKHEQGRRDYRAALHILEKIDPVVVKKTYPFEVPLAQTLATAHSVMGLLAQQETEHALACRHLRRALELTLRCFGPGSPEVALRRGNLGFALCLSGDAAGLRQMTAAVALFEKALGADHPRTAQARHNLALELQLQGRHAECWREMVAATGSLSRHAQLAVANLAQREHHWLTWELSVLTTSLLSHAEKRPALTAQQRRELLEVVLDHKGVSGNVVRARREALAIEDKPAARGLLARLNEARQLHADLLLQGPGPMPAPRHHATLAELRRREDRLERALAEAVGPYARQQQGERAGPAELARRLPKDGVLVEFVKYVHVDFDRVMRGLLARKASSLTAREKRQHVALLNARYYEAYAALVVARSDRGADVRFVPLGKAAAVEPAIRAWRAAAAEGRVDTKAEAELRRRVWGPVAKALPKGAARLFVAPDGELALVPFEALRLDDGRYLIERFTVNYLTSGRDLAGAPAEGSLSGPDLLLAAPDYDHVAGTRTATAPPPGLARALRGLSVEANQKPFAPLPGTAREADAVARLLRAADPQRQVLVRTGAGASEEALRGVRRPRLLLLSTHGFFLGGPRPDRADQLRRGLRFVAEATATAALPDPQEDPRVRSGLALAGANRWRERARKGLSDGLLTAYEVEGLDLWGTDLVVLSACETGLGQVQVGEGVIGLRRAFQLAGARTVVASLWKVPDHETQVLMTRFFALWLKGQGKAEALRAAQCEMIARLRQSPDPRHKHAPPLLWAGFICHGVAE
jgi:CHAT domain-containing protein/tetratricopeptide (TPR) repeat protein